MVLKKKLNNDTDELEVSETTPTYIMPYFSEQELCLGVNVEYSGGCRIGIDADLVSHVDQCTE